MVRYRHLLAFASGRAASTVRRDRKTWARGPSGPALPTLQIDEKEEAELTTIVFRHLRDSDYPANSFNTGHPAYDRYLAGAKEWRLDFRAMEGTTVWSFSPRSAPDAKTREVILREMPFYAPIEAEPAESLGRAMLINAYAVPRLHPGWLRLPSELRDKMQTAQNVFYAFTRQLPHARLSTADAEALL